MGGVVVILSTVGHALLSRLNITDHVFYLFKKMIIIIDVMKVAKILLCVNVTE